MILSLALALSQKIKPFRGQFLRRPRSTWAIMLLGKVHTDFDLGTCKIISIERGKIINGNTEQ